MGVKIITLIYHQILDPLKFGLGFLQICLWRILIGNFFSHNGFVRFRFQRSTPLCQFLERFCVKLVLFVYLVFEATCHWSHPGKNFSLFYKIFNYLQLNSPFLYRCSAIQIIYSFFSIYFYSLEANYFTIFLKELWWLCLLRNLSISSKFLFFFSFSGLTFFFIFSYYFNISRVCSDATSLIPDIVYLCLPPPLKKISLAL